MTTLDRISATFRVATPLFLGDANRAASRFSAASWKGAFRFWWRALRWPALRADFPDDRAALEALQGEERSLLGCAGEGGQGGQSRVLLRVAEDRLGKPTPVGQRLPGARGALPGAAYLGYGLMGAFGERAGVLDRSCFPAGGTFTIGLLLRRGVTTAQREDLLAALRLMGLLGGLGARSRRGWGSLALLSLLDKGEEKWRAPSSRESYKGALETVLAPVRRHLADDALPPFTVLSGRSRIEIVAEGQDPLALLDGIGRQMQRHRAWGHNGQVNGYPTEQNFRDDHDWFHAPHDSKWAALSFVPKRVAYGLPHNYSKTTLIGPAFKAAKEGQGRRASPLFVHVHQLAENAFAGVLSLLPAKLLPDDDKQPRPNELVRMTYPGGSAVRRIDTNWQDYLHELFDGPPPRAITTQGKYFPKRTPVLPPGAGGRR
jgi:CRISPR-associated protein Cmr1